MTILSVSGLLKELYKNMFLTIVEAVFFAVIGINLFRPFGSANVILGICAIVIAIIFIVNASRVQ